MYVCLCKAVTDADIHEAVNGGVRSMRQLAKATGCSSNCGRCAVTASEILGQATGQDSNALTISQQTRKPAHA